MLFTVISSEIPITASFRILSALANESFTEIGVSAYTSQSLSLLIIRMASTFFRISSTPFSARIIFCFFSKRKGIVTIPIVSNPILRATLATTGADPVPVPPPMLAVMNTIFVPSLSRCSMSAIFFSASERPTSGLPPAPRPSPSNIFTGTGDGASDLLSVLQTASVTPEIFSSYIFLTALHPPPPTPITLMMPCILSSTGPKMSNRSSIYLFLFLLAKIPYSSESAKFPQGLRSVISQQTI